MARKNYQTGVSTERDRILVILQNRIARIKREMMERAHSLATDPIYEIDDGGRRIQLIEEIIAEVMNGEIPN